MKMNPKITNRLLSPRKSVREDSPATHLLVIPKQAGAHGPTAPSWKPLAGASLS
jgi:hypothetical protein